MSLEQELMRNTEALVALTAALSRSFPVAGSGDSVGMSATVNTKIPKAKVTPAEIEALKEVEPPKPVEAVVAVTHPAASGVTTSSGPAVTASSRAATATAEKSSASVTSATTPTIEYAQVAAAIVATFKVDRTRVIDSLARFGAAKGPQLRPEDYAEFLAMLEDAPA